MKEPNDEIGSRRQLLPPVVVRLATQEFQLRVLEKLARLEIKMDMIVGNGQPGRMKLAEDRLAALEVHDLRRTVYDRMVTAAITFAISAVIAWRGRLGLK